MTDFERALDIGRPPNVKKIFPQFKSASRQRQVH